VHRISIALDLHSSGFATFQSENLGMRAVLLHLNLPLGHLDSMGSLKLVSLDFIQLLL